MLCGIMKGANFHSTRCNNFQVVDNMCLQMLMPQVCDKYNPIQYLQKINIRYFKKQYFKIHSDSQDAKEIQGRNSWPPQPNVCLYNSCTKRLVCLTLSLSHRFLSIRLSVPGYHCIEVTREFYKWKCSNIFKRLILQNRMF